MQVSCFKMAESDQEDGELRSDCDISSSDSEDEDPRLCFFSDKFDPLLVLNTLKVQVPDMTAKVFDNLEIYKNNIDRTEPRQAKNKEKVAAALKANELRRWAAHQSRLIMFLFMTLRLIIKFVKSPCLTSNLLL